MTPTIPTASSRTLRIYIAGPMTGLPEWNFPAFNAKAAELRELGWHVENPAEHGVQDGVEWADYLRYDLTRIATCEAMYLLPGWSNSRGARLEVHIGKALDMMFYGEPAADHDALPASTQPVQQDTQAPSGQQAEPTELLRAMVGWYSTHGTLHHSDVMGKAKAFLAGQQSERPAPAGPMNLDDLPVVAYGWENTRPGAAGLMLVELSPGQYPEIPTKLVRLSDVRQLLAAPAGQAVQPTWVNCETRGPWVRNGLKARIEELRKPGTRFQRFLTRKFFNSLISKEELQDLFTPIRRTYARSASVLRTQSRS